MTLRDALLRGKRRPRAFGSGAPTIYRGDGYEFVELRAYVPGDDVRRIDWAATARAGEMQTRVVLEDVSLTLAAMLDDSPSMRVGRRRPVLAAAREALCAWYDAATNDDRCVRIAADVVAPARLERGAHGKHVALLDPPAAFDLRASLRTARAVLPRGSALLAIGDWHDLDDRDDAVLHELGTRYDCTALVVRDPWHDGLPLRGFVRVRGAEGGSLRAFIGRRERECYARAVHARHEQLAQRFSRANWRVGELEEADGARSLAHTFGLPTMEHARR